MSQSNLSLKPRPFSKMVLVSGQEKCILDRLIAPHDPRKKPSAPFRGGGVENYSDCTAVTLENGKGLYCNCKKATATATKSYLYFCGRSCFFCGSFFWAPGWKRYCTATAKKTTCTFAVQVAFSAVVFLGPLARKCNVLQLRKKLLALGKKRLVLLGKWFSTVAARGIG